MKDNSTIHFCADLHLQHTNVAGPKVSKWPIGYRTFDSVKEMDRTLIKNINDYVKQEDTLYFLGDFCFGDKTKMQSLRNQIYCQNIIVTLGNHDKREQIERVFGRGNVFERYEFYYEKQLFCLSHYPHRSWNASHKGSIHLYGHEHDNIDKDGLEWGKSMDVGVDSAYRIFGEYRPFSIEEVLQIMSKRKLISHHE